MIAESEHKKSPFKSYDIRGLYGSEITIEFAYKLGIAYAKLFHPKTIVIGHDSRIGSEELSNALIDGLIDCGVHVTFIGICSTPMLYFCINKLNVDGGIVVTASHNPKEYNGFKVCGKRAEPIDAESGLKDMEKFVYALELPIETIPRGEVTEKNMTLEYVAYLLRYACIEQQIKIIIDASSGTVGTILPAVLDNLDVDAIQLNFMPDGNFPSHIPNPVAKESTVQLRQAILDNSADLGIIFDGDGDRVLFLDENGERVESDIIIAFLGCAFVQKLKKHVQPVKILYDVRASKAIAESIQEAGGLPIMCRVGHTYIKRLMDREKAVFGGELSGHFYYQSFFGCDNGIMTMLLVLEQLSMSPKSFSQMITEYNSYERSDEINVSIENIPQALDRIKHTYTGAKNMFELDGISIEYDKFWFNVRASNTEPLLRIKMEAMSEKILKNELDKLIKLIKS